MLVCNVRAAIIW